MRNPVEPLPPIQPNEIALMTREEFLEHINPGSKFHPSSAYDSNLESLNINYDLHHIEDYRTTSGEILRIYRDGDNFAIHHLPDDRYGTHAKLVMVIHQGTLYYETRYKMSLLPTYYRENESSKRFPIRSRKRVKYVKQYLPHINCAHKRNLKRYPILHQRILRNGSTYQIRFKQEPELNRGVTTVILNGNGLVIGVASNEWGATLIQIAREYRGQGFGLLLSQIWHQWNPGFPSGGLTSAGRTLAVAQWSARVREFRRKGWYRELLRTGQMDKAHMSDIFAGLIQPREREPIPPPKKPKIMIYVESGVFEGEPYWGPTFVIYDRAFLDEPDEKYIYGYGFFRENSQVGTYLYRIEHEPKYAKLTTHLALQIAKSNNELIYIGEDYGADHLDLTGIEDVQIAGEHVRLTEDVLELETLHFVEKHYRRLKDPHQEQYYRLLEIADAKWD